MGGKANGDDHLLRYVRCFDAHASLVARALAFALERKILLEMFSTPLPPKMTSRACSGRVALTPGGPVKVLFPGFVAFIPRPGFRG